MAAGLSPLCRMAAECAICFGDAEQQPQLPCGCTAAYCLACWDRALASSFNACGRARCPTCRSFVRADYDAATFRLKFSRVDEEDAVVACMDHDLDEDVEDQPAQSAPLVERERLRAQALPAQRELLRRYGRGRCRNGATVPCVCGDSLVLVTGLQRLRYFCQRLRSTSSGAQLDWLVERVSASGESVCSCDLCGASLPPNSAVWTCLNGNQTIVHANAYDICEGCFYQCSVATNNVDSSVTPSVAIGVLPNENDAEACQP